MENDANVTIQGIVIPVDWDEIGFVISLAVATFKEERYVVADTPLGWKLKAFLRKKVIVEGLVKTVGGDRFITVTAFRPDTETAPEDKRPREERVPQH
jgi:hypothetical protein